MEIGKKEQESGWRGYIKDIREDLHFKTKNDNKPL